MKFPIILVATLFVLSTADSSSEENRQAPKNGEHVPWGNWIGSMGGPQAFRVDVKEALRSILESEQSRAELLETLRSESASDAADKATEYLIKNMVRVCERTCYWRAECVNDPSYNPQKHIQQHRQESCWWEHPTNHS